jgi:hypothetical protein
MRRPKPREHDLACRTKTSREERLLHRIREGWPVSRILAKHRTNAPELHRIAAEHKLQIASENLVGPHRAD